MPSMKANGFSLFAEHLRPSLETQLNVQFNTFYEVIKAATPYWAKIDNEQKRQWKDRAKSYMKSDDYYAKQKDVRIRKVSNVKNTNQKKLVTGRSNKQLSDSDDDFGEIEDDANEHMFELPQRPQTKTQDMRVTFGLKDPKETQEKYVKETILSHSFTKDNYNKHTNTNSFYNRDTSNYKNINNKEKEYGSFKKDKEYTNYSKDRDYNNYNKDKDLYRENRQSNYDKICKNSNNNQRESGAFYAPVYKQYFNTPNSVPEQQSPAPFAVRNSKFLMLSVKMFKVVEGTPMEGMRGTPISHYSATNPAELGVVEFSLHEGITNVYWHVFGPWNVPTDMVHSVQLDAERTHGIPVTGCVYSDNNAEKALRAIFTRCNPELVPRNHNKQQETNNHRRFVTQMSVLCLEAERSNIVLALQQLVDKLNPVQRPAWNAAMKQLKLELMHVRDFVRGLAAHHKLNLTSTRPLQMLYNLNESPEKVVTPFDFHPGTLCLLHNSLQISCCAISTARKACYLLFQIFCRHLHVQPTDSHLPDFESQSFKDPSLTLAQSAVTANPYLLTSPSPMPGKVVDVNTEPQHDVSDLITEQVNPVQQQQQQIFTPLPIQTLFPNINHKNNVINSSK